MRRVVRQVDEERLVLVFLDVVDRPTREVIDHETFAFDDAPIELQHRTEVVAPVARTESVELVEATAIRMIRKLHSIVPFPESPRRIARRLEDIRDRRLVEVESLTSGRGRVDAPSLVIAPRQEFRPRRGANRTDIEPVEGSSVGCEGIDARRREIRIPVQRQVAPALVVCEKYDDVRLAGLEKKRSEKQEQVKQSDGHAR